MNTRHRRSLSISGSAFKNGGGASSPRSKARDSTLIKRRSASLAGGAAPPSSAKLELFSADNNAEGFEVVDDGPGSSSNNRENKSVPGSE